MSAYVSDRPPAREAGPELLVLARWEGTAMRHVDEAGRMIHGWRETLGGREGESTRGASATSGRRSRPSETSCGPHAGRRSASAGSPAWRASWPTSSRTCSYRGTTRLRPENLRRMRARVKHRLWQQRTGQIELPHLLASLRSATEHLRHGSTLALRRKWLFPTPCPSL